MRVGNLWLRLRRMVSRRDADRDLDDELTFHLEREAMKHVAQGMGPVEARQRARVNFGSVPLAADQCRDARPTALLETISRDATYAVRGMRRAPLAAFTVVTTIALGLGLVVAAFSLYNASYLGEAVLHPNELYAIERPPDPRATGAWIPFTRPQYEALRRQNDVFTDVLAGIYQQVPTRIGTQPTRVALVTGNFFQVLGVGAALGRTLTSADDEPLAGRRVVVLSDRGWMRLFGRDTAAIGQPLSVNGLRYDVVGVIRPDFRGIPPGYGAPDYWAPLACIEDFRLADARARDQATLSYILGRLKPGVSPTAAAARLSAWAEQNPDLKPERGLRKTIALRTMDERRLMTDRLAGLRLFGPIFIAFSLILLIGCANVASLLLARGMTRRREIGVRLALGASRRRIVRQLLTECVLLALLSAAAGLLLSRLLLHGLYLGLTQLPRELGDQFQVVVPSTDWRVVSVLVAIALVSIVFFGMGPALHATRVELVRAMRGEVTPDARPSHIRSVLIALQVTASALLLIGSAVFLRSAMVAAARDLGIRISDTLTVDIAHEASRASVIHAIADDPSVRAVAASWPSASVNPSGVGLWPTDRGRQQVDAGTPARLTNLRVNARFVSSDYLSILGINVVRGRGFTPDERGLDAGVIVLSETAAGMLWPHGDALGQVLQVYGQAPPSKPSDPWTNVMGVSVRVIGLARDVADTVRFTMALGPPAVMKSAGMTVYLPLGLDTPSSSIVARVNGDVDVVRQQLLARVTSVDPAPGDIRTMRGATETVAYIMWLGFALTVMLAALALALTVSGVFSVLSYITEQRRKEIGVRLALGATPRDIVRLVMTHTAKPVGLGALAGAWLACGLAALLLNLPVGPQGLIGAEAVRVGEVVRAWDPTAYALGLSVILSACAVAALIPALRAARVDPTQSLKQE